MARYASQPRAALAMAGFVLVMGLLAACQRAAPPPPAEAPPDEGVLDPRVAPAEVLPAEDGQPEPEITPGYAPGTIILDTTQNVSLEGGAVEAAFDSPAMQAIRIDVNAIGGTARYEWRLVDKFDNALAFLESDGTAQAEAIAEFTLPYAGTYRVRLTPLEGAGTRQVVVTALDAPSGGAAFSSPGETGDGALTVEHVYHTYTFPLVEGQVVSIAAQAATAGQPDTRFDLYGPDGRLLAQADDTTPGIDLDAVLPGFVAPLPGTYVAIVTNFAGTSGDYRFTVSAGDEPPLAEGEPDLAYDQQVRAAFFEGSPLSLSFDGALGDPLRIEVFDVEPGLDLDVRVISPFGQVIAYAIDSGPGQSEQIREMQLPTAGRYWLELTPFGSGQASFRVVQLQPGDLTGGGAFGDEPSGRRSGTINAPGAFHTFQFNARAGNRVTLVVTSQSTSGALDLGFALLGPDGRQTAFADDSTGGNPADPELRSYSLTQTGVYTVIVYSFNNALGTYELEYTRQD